MRITSILCGVVLLGAAQMTGGATTELSAQTLASRVRDAGGNATVRFEFAAREGICGDGVNIVTRRGNGDDDYSIMQSAGSRNSRKSRDEIMRNCEPGPVRVEIKRTLGKLASVEVRVGGQSSGNGTDLGAVPPVDAVRYLIDAVMNQDASQKFSQDALFAATLADAGAEAATGLIGVTRKTSLPQEVRKSAVFWLGQTGDSRGRTRIAEMLKDRSENLDVRKSAMFAITQFRSPESVDLLLSTARGSDAIELRKDAIFWLGQMAGEKASAGLKSVLDDDSAEIGVRESAIFAISQQKDDAAVQTLIDVATKSKEPKLRKSAMFWLGQRSEDPRVLKLFQDILTKKE